MDLRDSSILAKAIISESILKKASQKNIIHYRVYNLFEYSYSNDGRIDDYPFGGGEGMILKPEPIFKVLTEIKSSSNKPEEIRVIFPTPDGKELNHKLSSDLAEYKHLVFICGHYKGIDQRIRDHLVSDEISIGDYVLTGGELPTMVILDSIIRLIPGVLNNIDSAYTDSFQSYLLDSPYYTRPEIYRNLKVPEVLLSGHHEKIKDWKLKEKEIKTKNNRPD